VPTKAEKLLERLRNAPANCTRDEIGQLYLAFGFEIRHGAKHDIIKHAELPAFRQTLPRHSRVLITYVRIAVKAVDELKRTRNERK
jgi:hypothetical protein